MKRVIMTNLSLILIHIFKKKHGLMRGNSFAHCATLPNARIVSYYFVFFDTSVLV